MRSLTVVANLRPVKTKTFLVEEIGPRMPKFLLEFAGFGDGSRGATGHLLVNQNLEVSWSQGLHRISN